MISAVVLVSLSVCRSFSQMEYPHSYMAIGTLGSYFQSPIYGDLYNYIYAGSLLKCVQWCNSHVMCRSFEYNREPGYCRSFRVEPTDDQFGYHSSYLSQLGYVKQLPGFYASYNQSCDKCTRNRYLICSLGTCQCALNTFWNGTACEKQKYAAQLCTGNNQCRDNPYGLTCNVANVCSPTGESADGKE